MTHTKDKEIVLARAFKKQLKEQASYSYPSSNQPGEVV